MRRAPSLAAVISRREAVDRAAADDDGVRALGRGYSDAIGLIHGVLG